MHLLFLFYHLSLFFFPFFFLGNLYKVVTTMVRRAVKENFNCKHRALIFLWLFTSNDWEVTFPYFLKKNERTFQLYEPIESFISSFTAKTNEQWQVAFY